MKIGIYNPYLKILGGGERYIASIAEAFQVNHEVDLYTDVKDIKSKILTQFNINLDKVNIKSDKLFSQKGILQKSFGFRQYSIFFYVTDGSLFLSLASKNFLIIQSPVHIPPKKFLNKLKLFNWKLICYSQFISDIIQKKLNMPSIVLPPTIENMSYQDRPKENIILNVGRFFLYPHNKKQDVLIEVFKENYKDKFKDFTLILAGALTEKGGEDYLNNLKKASQGLPIKFSINNTYEELRLLYNRSKFYWHAAGFGEDLNIFPERAEHFGITTIEAMSAGCIPIVYNSGGQKEIVRHNQDGFLWNTKDELVDATYQLIKNKGNFSKFREAARKRIENYSKEKFYETLETITSR